MKKSWYEIKALNEGSYEVFIYDEIGLWGITAKDFVDEFNRIPAAASINLRISSVGGDIVDGLAIYQVIDRHPGNVNVTVDSIAASMAGVIALAGDNLAMPENTFLFIHDPISGIYGDADEMRQEADYLDKISAALLSTYVRNSNLTAERVADLMKGDTLLSAAEAKEYGFADEVTQPVKIAAVADLRKLKPEAQEKIRAVLKVEKPNPDPDSEPEPKPTAELDAETIRKETVVAAQKQATEIQAACNTAGVPQAALGFFAKGLSADEVKAKLANAPKIRSMCAAAKLTTETTDKYILSGLSIEEIKEDLVAIAQARDSAVIDNKLTPDAMTTTGKEKTEQRVVAVEIYERRAKMTYAHSGTGR